MSRQTILVGFLQGGKGFEIVPDSGAEITKQLKLYREFNASGTNEKYERLGLFELTRSSRRFLSPAAAKKLAEAAAAKEKQVAAEAEKLKENRAKEEKKKADEAAAAHKKQIDAINKQHAEIRAK